MRPNRKVIAPVAAAVVVAAVILGVALRRTGNGNTLFASGTVEASRY